MLRLEQLNYLRMVVRCNSIKIAAETLNVVPSTVSTSLHKMEDEIGISLLVRTYRGIEVTDAAREIAAKAEEIFGSMREIEGIIKTYNTIEKKENTIDNFFRVFYSRGVFQSRLEEIYDNCEKIGLDVECPDISRGNETYLDIINHDVDAVLINYFVEPAIDLIQDYENVSYIRLHTSKPYILCSNDCKFVPKHKEELTPEEAIQLPHLMFMEGYDRALAIYEFLEQYGPLNIAGKYSNINVLSAVLSRGKGVSVSTELRELKFSKSEQAKEMRLIPIKCDIRLSLVACYNRNITLEKRKMLDKLIPVFLEQ